jgi:hypothetical protein
MSRAAAQFLDLTAMKENGGQKHRSLMRNAKGRKLGHWGSN